jgi:hypothetical protein
MELCLLSDLLNINWATNQYFDARKIYNEPELQNCPSKNGSPRI